MIHDDLPLYVYVYVYPDVHVMVTLDVDTSRRMARNLETYLYPMYSMAS